MNKYDLALIDNDRIIHMAWAIEAKRLGKCVAIFQNKEEFLMADIPKDVTVYIDYNLDDGVLGSDVARDLFFAGWRDLHMATGYSDLKDVPYVKSIGGKNFPGTERAIA